MGDPMLSWDITSMNTHAYLGINGGYCNDPGDDSHGDGIAPTMVISMVL
jgi:hypothetical protein